MADNGSTPPVVSRKEAAAIGLKVFYTGVMCRHGHLSERHVFDGKCCACKREQYRKKEADPKTKKKRKDKYAQNREFFLQKARELNEKHRQNADGVEAKHYVPDRPCARGHSLRYVRTRLCVECAAIGRKKWRAENHEQTLELQRKWRADNPEREREGHLKSNRKWYYNTRDERRRKANEYYQNHKESFAEYAKARSQNEEFARQDAERKARWCKENPERVRQNHHNREARKRGNGGTHTAEDVADILKMQRDKCAYCSKNIKKDYTIDHIVPLSKGGSNDRRNLQATCKRCNSSKNARDPLDHARSLGKLL